MRIILTLHLILFVHIVVAQNFNRIDSLSKLAPLKVGAVQFDILNEIAWEYRFINQDSTIHFANRAFMLGKKIGLKKKLAKPLNFIGVAHEYKGESIEAYDFYKQALSLATRQNDRPEIAYANNNSGRLFFDQGNISRSLECYLTALKIFESLSDSLGIAYVYLNLAQLYQFKKDFNNAEEYFQKVYHIRLALSGTPNISSLLQLGIFYKDFGHLSKSNKHFQQADSLCIARGDEVSRAQVNILLAENRLKEGRLQEANDFAKRGFKFARKNNLTRDLSAAHMMMGKVSFELKDLSKAKEYFEKVIENNKPLKDVSLKMEAHYFLGRIYSKQGHTEKELKNQNQYLILRDSVTEKDLAKQIERLRFQFNLELEQKKRENELLKTLEASSNTIIKKQQTMNIVYAGALVIIIAIAVLLFRNAKMEHRHNIVLAEKQEKILKQSEELRTSNLEIEKINENLETLVSERTKTIQEKNEALSEYAYFNAHQVRGPLARILGLISILDMEYKKDAFGPYLHMLHQAGNDLDSAIKEINNILDKTTN